jgi:hypothetical protein
VQPVFGATGLVANFHLGWLIVVKSERNAAVYVVRTGWGEHRSSPMTINWLATTAIALVVGTGAVVAQSQPDLPQKREEGTRAQTPSLPSKEADRPAAAEQRPTDRLKDRATQSEPKAGAKEPQRGEAASPAESRQPTKQSEEQPSRGERPPEGSTKQSQDEQKGRDAKQPADAKQQQGRDERSPASSTKQSQDEQKGRDAKPPADSKLQAQQPGRDRNDQAAQPSATQQGTRPGDTAQDRQRGQNTGQAQDQSDRRGGTSSVTVNDEQRTQILERLRRERSASNENINIRVNVGERLPPRVRPRPLPPDIVRIAPQYRDYEYTVIEDRVAIVDPRTREVVDIIDEPGWAGRTASRVDRDRVVITPEQRETLKQLARRTTTVRSTSSSGSASDSSCLTLQPVPEDLVRNNPELGSYKYLAIGDQVVLVDPRQLKIVELID